MEEKTLNCEMVTPMFSYGAYPMKSPELRTTELKGAMRYTYRMICPAPLSQLAEDEAELFGGAAGGDKNKGGHASPVRIMMKGEVCQEKGKMLRHRPMDIKTNPPMQYFKSGNLDIIVRLNSCIKRNLRFNSHPIDLDWYADLIELTLVLCGLGRRSRKGRGHLFVKGREFESKKQAMEWLYASLNRFAAASSYAPARNKPYRMLENEIALSKNDNLELKRPVLERLTMGEKLDLCQIDSYLEAVDRSGHNAKKRLEEEQRAATGSLMPRLASPLLIGFMPTAGGIFPLYIFVKGIMFKKDIRKWIWIDSDHKYRKAFIQEVEVRMKGGPQR